MAVGRGIIAFLRADYFEYVDDEFRTDLPIINANKNNIYSGYILYFSAKNKNLQIDNSILGE